MGCSASQPAGNTENGATHENGTGTNPKSEQTPVQKVENEQQDGQTTKTTETKTETKTEEAPVETKPSEEPKPESNGLTQEEDVKPEETKEVEDKKTDDIQIESVKQEEQVEE